MKYEQRDVVEVNFMFPDGSFKPHPALIISNNELGERGLHLFVHDFFERLQSAV